MGIKNPYVFLFNADDKSLGYIYGETCTHEVIKALDNINSEVVSQILIGDVRIHRICSSISEISKSSNTSFNTTSYQEKVNSEVYQLVVCDFVDSLKESWHSIDINLLPLQLGNNNIYAVMLVSLEQESAHQLSQFLNTFPPYLGGAKIDTGNPIHCQILPLINGAFYENRTLYFFDESHFESLLDLNSRKYKSNSVKLSVEEYNKVAPREFQQTTLSVRGKQSLSKFEKKKKYSHRQRLTSIILEYLMSHSDVKDFYYSTDLMQNDNEFLCEKEKIFNYLLNINHSEGGPKAKYFIETLGISQNDWKYLSNQITDAMKDAILFRLENNQYGIKHRAIIKIKGRNGKTAFLETGWEITEGKSARLLTAYPYSKKHNYNISVPKESILPLNLRKEDKCKYIYSMANSAGLDAYNNCVPTPFVLQGYAPIMDGLCGFSWVRIFDARTSFVKWLKSNNIGNKGYNSGWLITVNYEETNNSQSSFQSFEPKKAYAESFARILTNNNIDCEVINNLD